jgi:plastocyanin
MGIANENGDQGQLITVHKGDSVIWESTDKQPHTVAQTNANEPGPFPVTPATFSTQSAPITFPNAGTWGYYCSIHGATSMSGTITVQ